MPGKVLDLMKSSILFSLASIALLSVCWSHAKADDLSKTDKKMQQTLSEEDQKELQLANKIEGKQTIIDGSCLSKFSLPGYDDVAAAQVDSFEHIDDGWSADASDWIRKHPATARKLYDDTEKTINKAQDKKCYVISYSSEKKNFANAKPYLRFMKRMCKSGRKGNDFPYFCPKSFGTNEILDELKNGALRFL